MKASIPKIGVELAIPVFLFFVLWSGYACGDALPVGFSVIGGGAHEMPARILPAIPTVTIHIQPSPHPRQINPGFLGTNNLYWIDNDSAWSDQQFVRQLKVLGVRTLRYPGGEVADNYDWETNRIERPEYFPYEAKTEPEREGRLDYKEFLINAKAANIPNLFFVVNLEGAFFRSGNLDGNIHLYADKAARWVRAVRDAGYRVEHWEIGNESYLKSAFALTAHEYAQALKIFYRKMKAADPTIKIGAIGPHAFKGGDAVGFADNMSQSGLVVYREELLAGKDTCEKGKKKACMQKFGISAAPMPVWWDVVLSEAADSFDFAVIHRYRTSQVKDDKFENTGRDRLGQYITELKSHIEAGKGAPVQLALTEWNMPNQSNRELDESEHALDIAEQIGSYLEGGVDFAMYWPMRLPGRFFTLLSLDEMQPTPSYHALALARRYTGEQIASAYGNYSNDLYILSTGYKGGYNVLLVNKATTNRCLEFVVGEVAAEIVSGEVFSDIKPGSSPRKLSLEELRDNKRTVCIPERAIVGLSVRR